VEDALSNFVLPNLRFIDDALVFDKVFYIEHGHRYDKFSHVVGEPLWKGTDELNIPFGSFLNRYLINNMELVYPYLDNIKPTENILHLLMREHFPVALKVLFYHIPFLVRIIPKRYYRYMFVDVLGYFIFLGVPLGFAVYMVYKSFAGDIPSASDMNPLLAKLFDASKSVGMLAASYFLSRALAYFRLKEATGLAEFARDIFNSKREIKYITMGHTHHADEFNEDGKWFFNSGTWIPVIESSSASLDEDRTFVFLHMKNDNGVLESEPLMRWNDDAGRPEELVLIRKKGD
jgi:UDP-2,3-diacylglucosamine pyrophosphatase LpxH